MKTLITSTIEGVQINKMTSETGSQQQQPQPINHPKIRRVERPNAIEYDSSAFAEGNDQQNAAHRPSEDPEYRQHYAGSYFTAREANILTNKLRIENGILYYLENFNFIPTLRLVIPKKFRQALVQHIHEQELIGHVGMTRTFSLLQQRFWWNSMRKDVRNIIKCCVTCQRFRRSNIRYGGPMQQLKKHSAWSTVGMDLYGPLPTTKSGNRFIVVLIDHMSKWPEIIPVPNITTETIATVLHQIISRHGCMKNLLTDRGPQFIAGITKRLCERYGIRKLFTSSYYPQANGVTESFMRVLGHSLATLVYSHKGQWDQYCDAVAFSYRITPHPATRETPFYILYGRDPLLPTDLSLEFLPNLQLNNVETTTSQRMEIIKAAQKFAIENLQRMGQIVELKYNQKHTPIQYEVGDLVLVKSTPYEIQTAANAPDISRKLVPKWSTPCRIIQRLTNKLTYIIQYLDTAKRRTCHVGLLRPFYKFTNNGIVIGKDGDINQTIQDTCTKTLPKVDKDSTDTPDRQINFNDSPSETSSGSQSD